MIFDPTKLPDYEARMEALRLHAEFTKAENTYQSFCGMDDVKRKELSDAAQAALDAYEAHGVDLLIDGKDRPILCALTGTPLLAAVEDSEWVLAAALKSVQPDSEDLDQEAA